MAINLRQILQDMGTQDADDPVRVMNHVETRRLRFDPPFSIKIRGPESDPQRKGVLVATRWDGVQSFLVVTDIYMGVAVFDHKQKALRLRSCIRYNGAVNDNVEEEILEHFGFKDFLTWLPYDHRSLSV
jgi:hypothetical protein